MESFYIVGGNKLNGKLEIKSAKNAILPINCINKERGNSVKIINVNRNINLINKKEQNNNAWIIVLNVIQLLNSIEKIFVQLLFWFFLKNF